MIPRLPDFTETGVSTLRDVMERLLEQSKHVKAKDRTEEIDLLLASNFLTIQLEELKIGLFHRNPATYTSEVIFGLISLCLREFAARETRLASILNRMKSYSRASQDRGIKRQVSPEGMDK